MPIHREVASPVLRSRLPPCPDARARARPHVWRFREAFARTEADCRRIREHRTAAKTEPKPKIAGRGSCSRYRGWASSFDMMTIELRERGQDEALGLILRTEPSRYFDARNECLAVRPTSANRRYARPLPAVKCIDREKRSSVRIEWARASEVWQGSPPSRARAGLGRLAATREGGAATCLP